MTGATCPNAFDALFPVMVNRYAERSTAVTPSHLARNLRAWFKLGKPGTSFEAWYDDRLDVQIGYGGPVSDPTHYAAAWNLAHPGAERRDAYVHARYRMRDKDEYESPVIALLAKDAA